jgi:hypothetical protein
MPAKSARSRAWWHFFKNHTSMPVSLYGPPPSPPASPLGSPLASVVAAEKDLHAACSAGDWDQVQAVCSAENLHTLTPSRLGEWMWCISQHSHASVLSMDDYPRYAPPAPQHLSSMLLERRSVARNAVTHSAQVLARMLELPAAQALSAELLDQLLPIAAFRLDRSLSHQLLALPNARDVSSTTLQLALQGALTNDDAWMVDRLINHSRIDELSSTHIANLLCTKIHVNLGPLAPRPSQSWCPETLQKLVALRHASALDARQSTEVLCWLDSVPVKNAVVLYAAYQMLDAQQLGHAIAVNYGCEPVALALMAHANANGIGASELSFCLSMTPFDGVREAIVKVADTHGIALQPHSLAMALGNTPSRDTVQRIGVLAIHTQVDIDIYDAQQSVRGHMAAKLYASALLLIHRPDMADAIVRALQPHLAPLEQLFPLDADIHRDELVSAANLRTWPLATQIRRLTVHAGAMLTIEPAEGLVERYMDELFADAVNIVGQAQRPCPLSDWPPTRRP